jgi:hypothetical protein
MHPDPLINDDRGNSFESRRLDIEWTTLCAIREMLGISLKGRLSPTYRQAMDIARIASPTLFDSPSSVLGREPEPALVQQYRQRADALSQLQGNSIEPLELLETDIEQNRRLLNTQGNKSQIQRHLASLEDIRPYFLLREYTESQLILRDVQKVERDLPEPPIDRDFYRDYRISDDRGLRLRLLHPDPPEHALGADLVSIRKVREELEKETHLGENGLRQQPHNPKVRHAQKAYHKTQTSRLLCRPETVVEADQASFSCSQQAWTPAHPRPCGVERDLVCVVDRLPVESVEARMVWCIGQHRPCTHATLARNRYFQGNLDRNGEVLPETTQDWLEVASAGWQELPGSSGR